MDQRQDSLEGLYRRHGPAVLAYLRARCRDRQAADDLLQDTFVQAAGQGEGIAALRSPRAWLIAVARNLSLMLLRRRRPVELADDPPSRPQVAADPRLDQMRQAVARLPEPFREVLELRLREELSYGQIAQVLEIPVGTVRSRLHHAVQRLRESLLTRRVSP